MKKAPAYLDAAFMERDEARPVRILSEYLAPLATLRAAGVCDTIAFFGSARITEDGPLGRYYTDARALAALVTAWSHTFEPRGSRLVVCSGGGSGVMEAVSRGARDAGGDAIGLNISLPHEQRPNAYLTPSLTFEFHYFFMRKLWFAHLARAIVVFPGGFGTLDELFEILTLAQTRKLEREIVVLLYGTAYWQEVVSFDALARHGVIAPEDLALLRFADDPREALAVLQREVDAPASARAPAFARSRDVETPDGGERACADDVCPKPPTRP